MGRIPLTAEQKAIRKQQAFTAFVLRELRQQKMKKSTLARRLNISPQLLYYKLNNDTFTLAEVALICKALDVSNERIGELIGWE